MLLTGIVADVSALEAGTTRQRRHVWVVLVWYISARGVSIGWMVVRRGRRQWIVGRGGERVLGRAFALRRVVALSGRGAGQAQRAGHGALVPASYSSSDSVTWACRQSQIFEGRRSRGKTGHGRMRRGAPGAHMGETAVLGGRNVLSTFQTFPRQHFSNLPPIVTMGVV